MTRPTIFVDLDGVMADFDGAFEPLFGFDHRTHPDADMWEAINAHGSYFRSLPPCPGALDFFDEIRHLSPIILTACPADNYADVAAQKRGWVREHLGDEPLILPTAGSKAKPFFMHRPGDVLIDDFESNIRRWNAAGGFGILHTGDWNATRARLLDYLGDTQAWLKSRPASGTSPALNAAPATTSRDTTTGTATASDANTTRQDPETPWSGVQLGPFDQRFPLNSW